MPVSDDPDPDEAYVIETLGARAGSLPDLLVGIGDDAALFSDGRVVTVDTMVEGVHWDDKLTPADVGWKLVAVNVSDVAAMGGRPEWAVLALSAPSPLDRGWIEAFAVGVKEACARWGVALIGGDTTRSPVRTVSLTVGGKAPRPVLRSGGRPGDDLWVTGTLGRAAEAFLAPAPREEARAWFRRPQPRLEVAVALAEAGLATAMMDLSDGLHADLVRMCAASGCGASVDPGRVPGDVPLAWRVGFGEDYELLFAAAADDRDAIGSVAEMFEIAITRVGCLEAGSAVRLSDGSPWPAPLFTHFRAENAGHAAPGPTGAASPSTRGAS